MNKKLSLLTAVLACAVTFTSVLSGCSFDKKPQDNKSGTPDSPNKLSIVTTIFPQYDFARQIAGDNAEITMLLGPGEESHSFEPTPQDIIDIQNADVFIYVGGESEEWAGDILKSFDSSNMQVINMMELVEPVEEEIVEGMENHEEESASDDSPEEVEYDEHVWTSIDNAQIIVQSICDALCEADEVNASTYTSNCTRYLEELSSIKKDITRIVSNAERDTIVFGDRFPIKYFADEFGLEYYAAFPGCAEQSEPNAQTVAFLIDKVNEMDIPTVFYLEFSNQKIADQIVESTDAQKQQFNSCHNVTMEQFLDGVTYAELMRENAEALETALN